MALFPRSNQSPPAGVLSAEEERAQMVWTALMNGVFGENPTNIPMSNFYGSPRITAGTLSQLPHIQYAVQPGTPRRYVINPARKGQTFWEKWGQQQPWSGTAPSTSPGTGQTEEGYGLGGIPRQNPNPIPMGDNTGQYPELSQLFQQYATETGQAIPDMSKGHMKGFYQWLLARVGVV
jgi:hypothetical protein